MVSRLLIAIGRSLDLVATLWAGLGAVALTISAPWILEGVLHAAALARSDVASAPVAVLLVPGALLLLAILVTLCAFAFAFGIVDWRSRRR
jgi:hypothetical protein